MAKLWRETPPSTVGCWRCSLSDPESIASFGDKVAAGTPAPGGGAVAAIAGALAAALPAMVARLALARPSPIDPTSLQQLVGQADAVRLRLVTLAEEDAAAFRSVIEARRTKDVASLEAAWREAARVPAEVVKQCLQVAQLARRAARQGPASAIADSLMAALVAAAAAAGSQVNLRLNVEAAGRPARLRLLVDESEVVLRETQRAARDVRLMVDEKRGEGEESEK